MKNLISHIGLTLIFALAFLTTSLAQDPYYSQYYNTPIYYNPAMTGITDGLKIKMMYRNQWPQYSDNLKGYNFAMDVAERYMPGAGGVGIIFNTNKEGKGLIKQNMIGGLASTRVQINRNLISQFGFMASYVQKQINNNDFVYSDQLDNRHGLLYPRSSFAGFTDKVIHYPDLAIGGAMNYQSEYLSFTFGAAVQHVLKPNESFYSLEMRVPRKYVAHADVIIFQVSNPEQGFRFNPGILYENQLGFSTYTLGANVSRSVLYAGAWYRNRQSQIYKYQSVTLLAGINIPMVNRYSRMKLMYSYDVSLTQMKGTGGTHEITLRFEFDEIHLIKSQDPFSNDYPIIYDPVVF